MAHYLLKKRIQLQMAAKSRESTDGDHLVSPMTTAPPRTSAGPVPTLSGHGSRSMSTDDGPSNMLSTPKINTASQVHNGHSNSRQSHGPGHSPGNSQEINRCLMRNSSQDSNVLVDGPHGYHMDPSRRGPYDQLCHIEQSLSCLPSDRRISLPVPSLANTTPVQIDTTNVASSRHTVPGCVSQTAAELAAAHRPCDQNTSQCSTQRQDTVSMASVSMDTVSMDSVSRDTLATNHFSDIRHNGHDKSKLISKILHIVKANMDNPTLGLEGMSKQELSMCLNVLSEHNSGMYPVPNMIMMILDHYNHMAKAHLGDQYSQMAKSVMGGNYNQMANLALGEHVNSNHTLHKSGPQMYGAHHSPKLQQSGKTANHQTPILPPSEFQDQNVRGNVHAQHPFSDQIDLAGCHNQQGKLLFPLDAKRLPQEAFRSRQTSTEQVKTDEWLPGTIHRPHEASGYRPAMKQSPAYNNHRFENTREFHSEQLRIQAMGDAGGYEKAHHNIGVGAHTGEPPVHLNIDDKMHGCNMNSQSAPTLAARNHPMESMTGTGTVLSGSVPSGRTADDRSDHKFHEAIRRTVSNPHLDAYCETSRAGPQSAMNSPDIDNSNHQMAAATHKRSPTDQGRCTTLQLSPDSHQHQAETSRVTSVDQPVYVSPRMPTEAQQSAVSSSCSPDERPRARRRNNLDSVVGYDGNPITSSGRNKGQGKLNEPKFPCQVCGDIAAGFHCGAYVCEACKKFYLRCLKNDNNVLTCPKSQQCTISRDNRSHCQFCRYHKCITLGMYRPGREFDKKLKVNFRAIPCKVCHAPSSGFHFGAITCEGCKGFFRRMLKENLHQKFTCSSGNVCEITSANRTFCKSCRFNKCLQVGMTLEGTRLGRQSNSMKRSTLLAHHMNDAKHVSPPKLMGLDEIKKEPEFDEGYYTSALPGHQDDDTQEHSTGSPRIKDDLQDIDDLDDMSLEIIDDFNFDPSFLDIGDTSKLSSKGNRDKNGVGPKYVAINGKGKGKGKGKYDRSIFAEHPSRMGRTSGNQDNTIEIDCDISDLCEPSRSKCTEDSLLGSRCNSGVHQTPGVTEDPSETTHFHDDRHRRSTQSCSVSTQGHYFSGKAVPENTTVEVLREVHRDHSTYTGLSEDQSDAARYYRHKGYTGNGSQPSFTHPSQSQLSTSSVPNVSGPLSTSQAESPPSPASTTPPSTPARQKSEPTEFKARPAESPSPQNHSKKASQPPVSRNPITGVPCQAIYTRPAELIPYLTKIYKMLAGLGDKLDQQKAYTMNVDDPQHVWTWCMISFVRDACLVLKYLKTIPGFRELPQSKQVDLTQESVYPICLLFHAQRHNLDTGKTPFFSLSREEMETFFTAFPTFSTMEDHFDQCGSWVRHLELDEVEIALVNVLFILTTAADRSATRSVMKENLENLTIAFMEYCDAKHPGRGGILLTRLAELQRSNIEHQEMAMVMRQEHPNLDHGSLWLEVYVQR